MPGLLTITSLLLISGVIARPDLPFSAHEKYRQTTLQQIIKSVNSDKLTKFDKLNILESAARIFEGLNPHHFIHLNLLRIDPPAELRKLKSQVLNGITNFSFHRKVIRIFSKMNDLHSRYFAPLAYRSAIASLGFTISSYYESKYAKPTYIIHGTNLTVTKIDGVPVHFLAIRLGNQSFGSNTEAGRVRGRKALTTRCLLEDPLPVKPNATIQCTDGINEFTYVRPWIYLVPKVPLLFRPDDEPTGSLFSSRGLKLMAPEDPARELHRLYRLEQQQRPQTHASHQSVPTIKNISVPLHATPFFTVAEVTTSSSTYGYINLHSFIPNVPSGFQGDFILYSKYLVNELSTTLTKMPYKGIVFDIRNNPGGSPFLVKAVFELVTSKNVPPMPIVLRATNLTLSMFSSYPPNPLFIPAYAAVQQSYSIGEQFTGPIIYFFNYSNLYDGFLSALRVLQVYSGKVVVLTSAESYSAADLFPSWMKDTGAGTIVGVDGLTGGGGAYMGWFSDISRSFSKTFQDPLPKNIDFTTAFYRLFRTGLRKGGTLIENFGIRPDIRYFETFRDVTCGDLDLFEFLGDKVLK